MESELKEIPIHVGDESAFHQIVDYFYSTKLDIKESNVQDLIPIAGLLQLRRVQHACSVFIKRKISSENCLGKVLFILFSNISMVLTNRVYVGDGFNQSHSC